jgi:outer membrane biosynthesis protein TonB
MDAKQKKQDALFRSWLKATAALLLAFADEPPEADKKPEAPPPPDAGDTSDDLLGDEPEAAKPPEKPKAPAKPKPPEPAAKAPEKKPEPAKPVEKPKAAPKPKPAPEPTPEPEPEETEEPAEETDEDAKTGDAETPPPPVTVNPDELLAKARAAAMAYASKHGREKLRALMNEFTTGNIGNIPADKLEAFIKKVS